MNMDDGIFKAVQPSSLVEIKVVDDSDFAGRLD